MTDPHVTSRPSGGLPTSGQRLPALSGIAFAVLLVVAFLLSGGDTPHYSSSGHAKAIATAAVRPFLVAPMGFVAFLAATGLATLRSDAFARWTGMVALLGALSFAITFLTTLAGTTEGSLFGLGSFAGFLVLLTWSTDQHRHVSRLPGCFRRARRRGGARVVRRRVVPSAEASGVAWGAPMR